MVLASLSRSHFQLTILPPSSTQNRDQLFFFLSSNGSSWVPTLCFLFSLVLAKEQGPGSPFPSLRVATCPTLAPAICISLSHSPKPSPAWGPCPLPAAQRQLCSRGSASTLSPLQEVCSGRTSSLCKSSHLLPLRSAGFEVTQELLNLSPVPFDPYVIPVLYLTPWPPHHPCIVA